MTNFPLYVLKPELSRARFAALLERIVSGHTLLSATPKPNEFD